MTPSELEYTQQEQRATLLLLNAGLLMMGIDDAIRAYRTIAFLMRDLRGDKGATW